jgi:hypothetical protein
MQQRDKVQLWQRRYPVLSTAIILMGMLALLVRREIAHRGYPSWDTCRCRFKLDESFFQVWHSWSEQQGDTLVEHEFGLNITRPPQWLRRSLHYGAQICAILNPWQRYVERVDISRSVTGHTLDELAWHKEITHWPRRTIGIVTTEMRPRPLTAAAPATSSTVLRALRDPRSQQYVLKNCCSLQAPAGTRVDFIGWAPTQIAYCTARLHPQS